MADAWYQLAAIYAMMKREEETFSYIEKALEWGPPDIKNMLENDADFGWLRKSTRWIGLMKEH